MNRIKTIHFYEVIRPLRTLFSTALGRKNHIHNFIVQVILENGNSGIGEVPTSFVLKQETPAVIKRILREFSCHFKALSINDYESKLEEFRGNFACFPLTLSGIEVALFRAGLKNKGVSEYDYWGKQGSVLETDITIPFILERRLLNKWLNYALQKKFKTYKIKLSGDGDNDKKFLSAVRGVLKNNLQEYYLRIDGNQGYGRDSFLKITDYLEKKNYQIQFFEQPLLKDDYSGLRFIKKNSPFPIILDESVFNAEDMQRVIDERLGDGVNIKIAKTGIKETLRILEMAKKNRLKLMIGCMTETMVGLSAGIYLALGYGGFDFIDLDSIYFLHHRKQYGNITINGPEFTINR